MKRIWLEELLQKKGFTHQKVADMVSVDRAYITQIINGTRRPSPEVAQRLGKKLKFDWTIFFKQECNESKQNDSSDLIVESQQPTALPRTG